MADLFQEPNEVLVISDVGVQGAPGDRINPETITSVKTFNIGTLLDKGNIVFDVKAYGAVGDGVANDASAIDDAHTAAKAAKGLLYFPAGTYKHVGDLTLDTDAVCIRGMGSGSKINFVDGGLVVNGVPTYRFRNDISDIIISRSGTTGAAIECKGNGSGTGAADWNFNNVRVSSSTGEALLIRGAYIGSFHGCSFRGAVTGIKITNDVGSHGVYGNMINFHGGEVQGCQVAANITLCLGVNFYGTGFEGNTTSGIEIPEGAKGFGLYGCYFESNNGWDVKIGTTSSSAIPVGVVILGGFFNNGTSTKTSSIQLIRAHNIYLESNAFYGWESDAPIAVNEGSVGAVTGTARFNTRVTSGGYAAAVALNGALQLEYDTVYSQLRLSSGSTVLKRHFNATVTLDFPSIAANTTATLTATVTGAAVGDDATAHPNSVPETGLVWNATVTATNTVTVTMANVTTGAIDPVARNWRINVWGH